MKIEYNEKNKVKENGKNEKKNKNKKEEVMGKKYLYIYMYSYVERESDIWVTSFVRQRTINLLMDLTTELFIYVSIY